MESLQSELRQAAARVRCAAVRKMIRPMLAWAPITAPSEGYSLILGVNAPLAAMLPLQLRLLDQQRRDNLCLIHIVIDTPRPMLPGDIESRVRAQFTELPMQFHYYSEPAWRKLRRIGWSKCYSWHSWSLGLSHVRSRYAMLHDYDAFTLHDDFLEQRYKLIRESGASFFGFQNRSYREWQTNRESDPTFAGTWEMMFDAALVREKLQPIDLFNRFVLRHGKLAMLDTFHDAQYRLGGVAQSQGTPYELVHASQMICQVTHLCQARSDRMRGPDNMNLLLVPYLLAAVDEDACLSDATAALQAGRDVPLLGKFVNAEAVTRVRAEGLSNIIIQLERKLHGRTRPHVLAFIRALCDYAWQREGAPPPAIDGQELFHWKTVPPREAA